MQCKTCPLVTLRLALVTLRVTLDALRLALVKLLVQGGGTVHCCANLYSGHTASNSGNTSGAGWRYGAVMCKVVLWSHCV